MTHKRFLALLREKYPEMELALASAHGGYANTRNAKAVGIVFSPGGKVYEYTGTYTAILCQLGIIPLWQVWYKYDRDYPRAAEVYTEFYTFEEAAEFARRERERNETGIRQAQELGYWVPPMQLWEVLKR